MVEDPIKVPTIKDPTLTGSMAKEISIRHRVVKVATNHPPYSRLPLPFWDIFKAVVTPTSSNGFTKPRDSVVIQGNVIFSMANLVVLVVVETHIIVGAHCVITMVVVAAVALAVAVVAVVDVLDVVGGMRSPKDTPAVTSTWLGLGYWLGLGSLPG